MLLFTLGLLLGSGFFQQSATLPSLWYLLPVGLLLLVNRHWHLPAVINGLLFGWGWALLYAHWHMPEAIPDLQIGQTYLAQGVIESLPEQSKERTRFYLKIHQLRFAEKQWQGNWRLRVSWRHAAALRVGQQWQLALRIKPVRSYQNPGSWDYAGWLYQQGVRYSAYVRKSADNQYQQESACCWLNQIRQSLRDEVLKRDLSDTAQGILLALTLGDRSGLSYELKQLFAQTGTSHLMAISGLHIGLVAGLCAWLVNRVWRRIPYLCRRYPAILTGVIAGLLAGMIYAALSGMNLPAQRAVLMLLVFGLALLSRQRIQPMHVLAMAAVLVVLWQPNAVIQASFWLSFVAVACIFVLLPQLTGRHWLVQAVILQLGISLALYPVLWLFGMPGSVVSPWVNLFMVPLFGLLIVPIALLSMLFMPWIPITADLLVLLGDLLDTVVTLLRYIAEIAPQAPLLPWSLWLWLCMATAVICVLLPIAKHWRIAGLCGFIALWPLSGLAKPNIQYGDYRVTVLDVGQGLSIVVQTQKHTLLYDTGAAYPSGFNLADSVVLPYLRTQGIQYIDTLILSHGDNDHAGAAQPILDNLVVDKVLSGEPDRLPVQASKCQAGQAWQWDSVHFMILHPQQQRSSNSNNQSCVLRISNAVGHSLLPGDIEARVENALLQKVGKYAPFSLVVVPHHGSKSSSSLPFVQTIQAQHVVYSSGAYNRYGFPKKAIVERWQNAGAKAWRTDQSGALQFDFAHKPGSLLLPLESAKKRQRYWHLTR